MHIHIFMWHMLVRLSKFMMCQNWFDVGIYLLIYTCLHVLLLKYLCICVHLYLEEMYWLHAKGHSKTGHVTQIMRKKNVSHVHVYESFRTCHTHKCATAHILAWRCWSNYWVIVTHVNVLLYTSRWVMSSRPRCHTPQWVMSHTYMGCVTRSNESDFFISEQNNPHRPRRHADGEPKKQNGCCFKKSPGYWRTSGIHTRTTHAQIHTRTRAHKHSGILITKTIVWIAQTLIIEIAKLLWCKWHHFTIEMSRTLSCKNTNFIIWIHITPWYLNGNVQI